MKLLIYGGTVWSAVPGQAPSKKNILVENGRIQDLYNCGDNTPDLPDLEKLDITGKTVVPGLVNAHVHITFDGRAPDPIIAMQKDGPYITLIKAIRSAKEYLNAGVTTIRDMGAADGTDIALKKAINEGLVEGPRMLVSGRCLCMTGGQGHEFGTEVDGIDSARHGARLHLKQGVDIIKMMATGGVNSRGSEPGAAQLTLEEMAAMAEEGHKAGRRVAAHAHGNQGIKNALKAGVDTLEHGVFLDEEAIRMMLERGVYLVPTLSPSYFSILHGTAAGINADAVRKSKLVMEIRCNSFRKACEAGVKIAFGTDQGSPLNRHGSIVQEMRLMIEHGLTPEEVLMSTTRVAAEALGMADRIGTIETGKLADILVLDGDPLKDINQIENISRVMKEGKTVYSKNPA